MGIFDKLFGKKENGVIADTSYLSVDWLTTTLRFLSELFPTDAILYHAKNENMMEEFYRSPNFWGVGVKAITQDKISRSPFISGINLFDTPVLLGLVIKGAFRKLKCPFLFTGDSLVAMKSTSWESPTKNSEHQIEGYLIGQALMNRERGQPVPPSLKVYESYADFIILLRTTIGAERFDYDFFQIGYGWFLVKEYISFVHKLKMKDSSPRL